MRKLVKIVVNSLALVGGLQLFKEFQNRQPNVAATDINGAHKVTTI